MNALDVATNKFFRAKRFLILVALIIQNVDTNLSGHIVHHDLKKKLNYVIFDKALLDHRD